MLVTLWWLLNRVKSKKRLKSWITTYIHFAVVKCVQRLTKTLLLQCYIAFISVFSAQLAQVFKFYCIWMHKTINYLEWRMGTYIKLLNKDCENK